MTEIYLHIVARMATDIASQQLLLRRIEMESETVLEDAGDDAKGTLRKAHHELKKIEASQQILPMPQFIKKKTAAPKNTNATGQTKQMRSIWNAVAVKKKKKK